MGRLARAGLGACDWRTALGTQSRLWQRVWPLWRRFLRAQFTKPTKQPQRHHRNQKQADNFYHHLKAQTAPKARGLPHGQAFVTTFSAQSVVAIHV